MRTAWHQQMPRKRTSRPKCRPNKALFFPFCRGARSRESFGNPPGASDVKGHSHVAKHLNNKKCHKVCLRFWAQPNADQYGMPTLQLLHDLSKHISALNVESQFPGDHTIARSFINGVQDMKRPELRHMIPGRCKTALAADASMELSRPDPSHQDEMGTCLLPDTGPGALGRGLDWLGSARPKWRPKCLDQTFGQPKNTPRNSTKILKYSNVQYF